MGLACFWAFSSFFQKEKDLLEIYYQIHQLHGQTMEKYCELLFYEHSTSHSVSEDDGSGEIQEAYLEYSNSITFENYTVVSSDFFAFYEAFRTSEVVFCDYVDDCPSEISSEYFNQVISFVVTMVESITTVEFKTFEEFIFSSEGQKLSKSF